MQICGIQKTTLLDYPGHVAATVFTGGCNFRCPFCHNGDLVRGGMEQYSVEEILKFLKKRQGILEGVCITGGEPTLQPDLPEFIREIRGLGYLVKLDTNGYRPEALKELLQEGLLDYVAMDIKAGADTYGKVAGVENLELSRIRESILLVRSAGIPYEFRTTLVKGLHEEKDVEAAGELIRGADVWYLQDYVDSEKVLERRFESFSAEEMERMAEKARNYIARVELRGVK